jgi:hypothetical protein
MATGMVRALRLVLATGLVIGSGQGVLAQVAAPTPKPPETVIKVSVKLVQVDATVTDEKGHAVRDLQAQDFEILQDGKPQVITNCGAIQLGQKMTPGDYVLQIAVTDKLAKEKHGLVTQAVDFEVQ